MSQFFKYSVLILTLSSLVFGQAGPRLDISISEVKINLSADEKKSGITTYAPGDTIEYTLTSKNVGDALMTNPVITDPIPQGVSYVAESVTGADCRIVFSIDKGKSYHSWPVKYKVRNSSGELVEKIAPPDMISHVQWQITRNLNAGDAHTATFRVVVNP